VLHSSLLFFSLYNKFFSQENEAAGSPSKCGAATPSFIFSSLSKISVLPFSLSATLRSFYGPFRPKLASLPFDSPFDPFSFGGGRIPVGEKCTFHIFRFPFASARSLAKNSFPTHYPPPAANGASSCRYFPPSFLSSKRDSVDFFLFFRGSSLFAGFLCSFSSAANLSFPPLEPQGFLFLSSIFWRKKILFLYGSFFLGEFCSDARGPIFLWAWVPPCH